MAEKNALTAALQKSKERAVPGVPAAETFTSAATTTAKADREATKRTTLDLPESLHKKFKLRSVTHGPNMADMIAEAMRKYSEGWE